MEKNSYEETEENEHFPEEVDFSVAQLPEFTNTESSVPFWASTPQRDLDSPVVSYKDPEEAFDSSEEADSSLSQIQEHSNVESSVPFWTPTPQISLDSQVVVSQPQSSFTKLAQIQPSNVKIYQEAS